MPLNSLLPIIGYKAEKVLAKNIRQRKVYKGFHEKIKIKKKNYTHILTTIACMQV